MEMKQIKTWLKRYKRLITCFRFMIIYFLVLNLAKYSSVFNTGFIPKDLFSAAVIGALIIYRFFCITFVPAIIFLWLISLFKPGLLGSQDKGA